MKHRPLLFLLAFCHLLVANESFAADGQLSIPEIADVRVGFNGRYRVGYWTPVWVTIRGGNTGVVGRLEIAVPDGSGVTSVVASRTVSVSAGSEQTVVGYAKFGRVRSGMSVSVVGEDGAVVSRRLSEEEVPDAALSSQQLVLSLGQSPGIDEAIPLRRGKDTEKAIHAALPVIDALDVPDRWLGYDGVSVVVLTGSQPGLIEAISSEQMDALDRWVQLGGRLILCVGASGEELLGLDGRLARFTPGRFDRVAAQRQTSGLETFAGTSQRLDAHIPEGELAFSMPLAVIRDIRGRVEASEGFGAEQRPTIIRASHGLGHVIFVGLDLDQPPFTEWTDGRARLLTRLLDLSLGATSRDDDEPSFGQITDVGFDDLSGQLRGALDQFPGVRLVPFSLIAVLISLYIVLIGPGDFFLLRWFRRRFEWTWLTFPAIVLLGCLLAGYLAHLWKGSQLRVNKIDLVDIDLESQLVRGSTWTHLFSPRSQTYDLSLQPALGELAGDEPAGSLLSWQGLPGDKFGGMNNLSGDASDQSYRVDCDVDDARKLQTTVHGMPIDVWSSHSLMGRWWNSPDLTSDSKLVALEDGQLSGRVHNPLSVELADCMLCYQRRAYNLRRIAPRQAVSVPPQWRTMDWMLTKTKVRDSKDVSTPWDRQSFEVPRIMEMMMFYRAAGGRGYTNLLNRYQSFVDLSDHLQTGRAILVGRTEATATELIQDGQPLSKQPGERWTFIRLVVPVEPDK